MKKILALSIGGLGDTVLFSPILKALRRSYPKAYIELLVANRLAQETYSCAEEISHVTFVNLNRSSAILKATALIPFIFESYLSGRFDHGFFATGLNPQLVRLIKAVGIVRNIACAPYVPSCVSDLHCNLELARSVDGTISEQDIFIPHTEEAELEVIAILNQHNISFENDILIAVYPSIELMHRPRWKIVKLLKVIQLIKSERFSVKAVIVGSHYEGNEWAVLDKNDVADANLAGKLSILGSAALLRRCSLTLGNDGGLMHVAGAVGSPLVTIMANTPLSYRPPGGKVKIIHSKYTCCDGLYPNRPKDCKIAKCSEDITVRMVFKACKSILGENGTNPKRTNSRSSYNAKVGYN
ncbi:MAG: glycosyltransferase family 9 protein [Desulfobacterales bacterium]